MAKQPDFNKAFESRQLPKRFEQFKDDTDTRVFHIRLHKQRAEALRTIFRSQGHNMTTGIRAVLYDWLAGKMR